MASGDGKGNPFGDGKGGAVGNSGGGTMQGFDPARQQGPDRPQRMGATNFNPDSVAPGGRVLKLDPKGDRGGLLGQTVSGMTGKKPFKLGGSGPSMPDENADADEGGPVGDIPAEDMGDGGTE